MNSPKCFVAIFGDPQQPNKSLVESGEYDPDPRYAPFGCQPGDLMLLYCTNSYPGRPTQIVGIGVVLGSDSKLVKYRWLPLRESIPKARIESGGFEREDLEKFRNRRFSSHWLFEISLKSFANTVAQNEVDWMMG